MHLHNTHIFSLERQSFLDTPRGFAIFAIILVNISVFSSVYYGSGIRDHLMISAMGCAVSFFVSMFFETKFYLLFSFLFGYSFTIQMAPANRKSQIFSASIITKSRQVFYALLG